jgi:hypothetical protein
MSHFVTNVFSALQAQALNKQIVDNALLLTFHTQFIFCKIVTSMNGRHKRNVVKKLFEP